MSAVDAVTSASEELSAGFMSGIDQVNRPRVVPLRRVGSSYRSTPLVRLSFLVLATPITERADILRNRRKRRLIRGYRSGRKKVRGMEPPIPKDYILLLKGTCCEGFGPTWHQSQKKASTATC